MDLAVCEIFRSDTTRQTFCYFYMIASTKHRSMNNTKSMTKNTPTPALLYFYFIVYKGKKPLKFLKL